MRESIRPVAGAITLLALMVIRHFWPHNAIGLEGPVVTQALKLRVRADVPSMSTSHSIAAVPMKRCRADQAATYSSFRASRAQAIRAVLLASATTARLKPRLATSAFSHCDRGSSCFARRLTTARAPWIIWRLR